MSCDGVIHQSLTRVRDTSDCGGGAGQGFTLSIWREVLSAGWAVDREGDGSQLPHRSLYTARWGTVLLIAGSRRQVEGGQSGTHGNAGVTCKQKGSPCFSRAFALLFRMAR
jgi:hypothetical protein